MSQDVEAKVEKKFIELCKKGAVLFLAVFLGCIIMSVIFLLTRVFIIAWILIIMSYVAFSLLLFCVPILAFYYLGLPIIKSLIKMFPQGEPAKGERYPLQLSPTYDPLAYMDYIASGIDIIEGKIDDLEDRLRDLEDGV
jgi:hypothetical protein